MPETCVLQDHVSEARVTGGYKSGGCEFEESVSEVYECEGSVPEESEHWESAPTTLSRKGAFVRNCPGI